MKSVLLIIGGGIAAYKSLELIRLLKGRGIGVKSIMTRAAGEFVTPLSVASLSGAKVHTELFDLTDEIEMGHIELSRSADLLVVVPATADLMAKMAQGRADDLASTALLATDKPVLVAPAMNVRMWQHPATQRNLRTLTADGIHVVGPNDGEMACGEFGPGRMAEPSEILSAIEKLLTPGARPLAGRKVVITAGPTREPIDPVRFISNQSSGKQGYAIAEAAVALGAEVILVSGPTALPIPPGAQMRPVETALRDAQGLRGGTALRHCHLHGRRGRLARGFRRGTEAEERGCRAAGDSAGRKSRHSRNHRAAQECSTGSLRRLCRRDAGRHRQCEEQAGKEGLRSDRRQ